MTIPPRPADRQSGGSNRRARANWHALTDAEKRQAVIDLAALYPPYTIAAACGLSIEAVRAILAERVAS